MGFQPAGVKTFLELDDTPSAYTDEAGKAAMVNAAETALEFGAVAGESVHTTYETTEIFAGTAPTAWADLDVGVANAIVFIHIERASVAFSSGIQWRIKGDTLDASAGLDKTQIDTNCTLGYMLVVTDADGLIQWLCSPESYLTLNRMAYWKNIPRPDSVISSGTSPASGWYDLNVGVANALAVLAVTWDSVAFKHTCFCKMGETPEYHYEAGAKINAIASLDNTRQGYALIQTDAVGYCRWLSPEAGLTYSIKLRAYIPNIEPYERVIFSGIKDHTWTDLTADYIGRCFAFLRVHRPTVTQEYTIDLHFRADGETLVPGRQNNPGTVGSKVVADLGYTFMPFDENDTIEFDSEVSEDWEVKTECLIR